MKIISFINRKGGAGKTTLLCLCALFWAREGKRVLVIDRDPQGSSASFVTEMEDPNISADPNQEGYDIVLIDTPGGIREKDLKDLINESDLVIIPFCLGPTDMVATRETAQALPKGSDNVRLTFNQVNPQTAIFKNRLDYAKLLGVKPLKKHLVGRIAYRYAVTGGYSELRKVEKEELGALMAEIEREVS